MKKGLSLLVVALSVYAAHDLQASLASKTAQAARTAFRSTIQQCKTQGFCTWKQSVQLRQFSTKLPKAEIKQEMTQAVKQGNYDPFMIVMGALGAAEAAAIINIVGKDITETQARNDLLKLRQELEEEESLEELQKRAALEEFGYLTPKGE